MNWSIQEELEEDKLKLSKDESLRFSEEKKNEKNQLALIRDIVIEKNLNEKVQSLFCKDIVSSEGNNPEVFKKLLDEVRITKLS